MKKSIFFYLRDFKIFRILNLRIEIYGGFRTDGTHIKKFKFMHKALYRINMQYC